MAQDDNHYVGSARHIIHKLLGKGEMGELLGKLKRILKTKLTTCLLLKRLNDQRWTLQKRFAVAFPTRPSQVFKSDRDQCYHKKTGS